VSGCCCDDTLAKLPALLGLPAPPAQSGHHARDRRSRQVLLERYTVRLCTGTETVEVVQDMKKILLFVFGFFAVQLVGLIIYYVREYFYEPKYEMRLK